MKNEPLQAEKHWLIGKSEPKIDGYQKVTGDLRYIDDTVLPGMLYGAILRSPHSHARIRKIDTGKAEALKGVRAVITAADTEKVKFSFRPEQADNLVLCDEYVRFIGDEVAAVAAETPEIAEQALELIEVDYEMLPAVYHYQDALKEESARVHQEADSNIAHEMHTEYGDVEAAFAKAAYIYEDHFETSKQAHCCLETRACIAEFDQSGRLTVRSQTQTPHTLRKELAMVLNLPISQVRVIRMPVGGGFGNRLVMDMKEPIAAFLAKKTKKPVRISNSRQEEFMTARPRYPYQITLKTAVTKEGEIIARHCTATVDNGAYNDKGPNTMSYCENVNSCFYRVPNTKFDGYIAYTNNQYCTGFRGFGNPQITFAIESQMDLIADRLGIDPARFRLLNAHSRDEVTSSGKIIDTESMRDTLEVAMEKARWQEKRELYAKQPENATKRRGIGLACMLQSGGGSRGYGFNSTEAFVKISEEGQVTIITPAVEIGQGPQTAMAQIAGEVLGVPSRSIHIIDHDTDIIPFDLGTWGSRTTFVNGIAVQEAAEQARNELLELAGKMFALPPADLICRDGKIGPADQWEKAVDFAEVTRYAAYTEGRTVSGKGRFFDPEAPKFKRGEGSHNFPNLVYGCQIAEVEVDVETGQVKVLNIVAAHDVGKAINPKAVEGQLEGGIIQGVGYALTEGVVEQEGRNRNPSFLDYKILSSSDIPEMEIIIVEDLENKGPFKAKGVGEQGIVPTAPAIANAISNAIGARIYDLPMKPEKILSALGQL
ncbi:xanthine dehydrogenase family protein molybdopterin-binding subunit [Alkalihalobacillus oceani]|uniref:Xanthine dehydrogenase family protein molybdopterin-binding subunit n=1 Tax=Halalkalibacter oceani TaxID=1653776 RepID=A0A9X2DSK3_9BACI|nr:xanthine dehydrogenase family protein molybdopterin-binding subunit [Halalkalibacter oceani]MCM3715921.1 xanthine dehydrogenase family protein molybdopterin-binding subunit [Halalkalibacter oceani]